MEPTDETMSRGKIVHPGEQEGMTGEAQGEPAEFLLISETRRK